MRDLLVPECRHRRGQLHTSNRVVRPENMTSRLLFYSFQPHLQMSLQYEQNGTNTTPFASMHLCGYVRVE